MKRSTRRATASPSAFGVINARTDRLPYPHISKEFPGKVDTSTPYVIGKIVSRLEMDSRWALARSVRALVAERDALKENLKAVSRSTRQEVE